MIKLHFFWQEWPTCCSRAGRAAAGPPAATASKAAAAAPTATAAAGSAGGGRLGRAADNAGVQIILGEKVQDVSCYGVYQHILSKLRATGHNTCICPCPCFQCTQL